MWIKVGQVWPNNEYASCTKDYDLSNSMYLRYKKKKKRHNHYVSYLLLKKKPKLPQKLSDLKQNMHYLSGISYDQEFRSRLAGWFWFQIFHLSWCCSKDVSRGCSHLKAWLGLEIPLPRWLTHRIQKSVLTVCLSFLPNEPFHRAA